MCVDNKSGVAYMCLYSVSGFLCLCIYVLKFVYASAKLHYTRGHSTSSGCIVVRGGLQTGRSAPKKLVKWGSGCKAAYSPP